MLKNDQEQHFNNFTSILKYGKRATLLCGAAGTQSNRIYQKTFLLLALGWVIIDPKRIAQLISEQNRIMISILQNLIILPLGTHSL